MRDPLIVVLGGGSSSILLPPNPTPPPSHHHHQSFSSNSNKPKPSSSKHFPAKLSCSSSSFSQVSTSTSSTSSSRPPLLMNVRLDLNPSKSNRLNYYADLASKLAENGKLEDFVMIAETVGGLDSESNSFVASLNIKLVSSGFSSVINEEGIESIVEVLSRIQKLGICPSSLFDRSARMSIALECRRILNSGKLEDFVGLMEMLAGFKFSVREFADPFEVIKMCVEKRVVKLAVRYACILPHASVLFRSIIHGFGKKRDLVSALIAYKESKCHLNGPNMQICRTIIDVCGLCGNSLKSRFIYEELLAQKVTPNNYVFNSLMNVNAQDLSYILHVYKHMQILGVVPDITSYNILLKACCLSGRVELAQDIYMEVRDMASTGALKLDVITYSTIIKVFADAKMWQVALKVKEDMLLAGVTPNVVTWSSLITACANMGLVEQAIQVFEEMLLSGCEPNTQCCNTLLNACVEACQYDRAFRIFQSWKANGIQKSCHPNESNANTGSRVSIGAEYSGGDGISKLVCSDPHRLSFVKVVPFIPTTATYNILMKACGTAYRRAKSLMDEMKTAGLSPDQISWSILINIFGSVGNVGGVIQGLKSMRAAGITPDVVTYTTAIKACVANEQLDMAFYLFDEMKEYQLQPNLVTYNTLLRARSRYGSLHEVQQSLAISQHMQKAGYSSNDYFLKDLIEEWCEGVIQNSRQNEQNLSVGDSRDKTDMDKSHRLLLNKVAVHLQKDITESLSIDIRGFSKVEARIVVLAVLRMIKESYALGDTIKDDMVIIFGVVKEGSMSHESELQALMVKLLRDELGLDVILIGPRVPVTISDQRNPPNSDQNHENLGKGKEFVSLARRPAILARLKVTKNSLHRWLEKRVGSSSTSSSSR